MKYKNNTVPRLLYLMRDGKWKTYRNLIDASDGNWRMIRHYCSCLWKDGLLDRRRDDQLVMYRLKDTSIAPKEFKLRFSDTIINYLKSNPGATAKEIEVQLTCSNSRTWRAIDRMIKGKVIHRTKSRMGGPYKYYFGKPPVEPEPVKKSRNNVQPMVRCVIGLHLVTADNARVIPKGYICNPCYNMIKAKRQMEQGRFCDLYHNP